MGDAIVITSGKGGVGKTTICAMLGILLARQGKQVLLIDTDIGLRNLDVLLGLEDQIVYDLVDLAEGTCRVKQALTRDKNRPGLTLLAAAQMRDHSAVHPEDMRRIMPKLKEMFDVVLIDCPAGVGRGFRNAVAAADRALIVTTLEHASLRDAERVHGLLRQQDMAHINLLLNRVRKANMRHIGPMHAAAQVGVPILGVISESESILNAALHTKTDQILKSPAASQFQAIAERLILDLESDAFPRLPWYRRLLQRIFLKENRSLYDS